MTSEAVPPYVDGIIQLSISTAKYHTFAHNEWLLVKSFSEWPGNHCLPITSPSISINREAFTKLICSDPPPFFPLNYSDATSPTSIQLCSLRSIGPIKNLHPPTRFPFQLPFFQFRTKCIRTNFFLLHVHGSETSLLAAMIYNSFTLSTKERVMHQNANPAFYRPVFTFICPSKLHLILPSTDTQYYFLNTKTPSNSKGKQANQRAMLGYVVRAPTIQVPVYALMLCKQPLRIRQVEPGVSLPSGLVTLLIHQEQYNGVLPELPLPALSCT